MIVLLASLFVTGGLGLAAWTLLPTRQQVIGIDGDLIPTSRALQLEGDVGERLLSPALRGLASAVRRFTPSGLLERTAKTLRVADLDKRVSPELVVGLQAGGAAVGGLLSAAYLRHAGVTNMNLTIAGLFVLVLVLGPNAKVKLAADDRRKAIANELPDVLDQLTVTVEAGMSFDGALLRAGQEGRGLLAGELLRAVHDMQLGLSRGEALMAMVDRTDVADLRSFVSAVRQAEKHGFPLAGILRLQSQELRDKRRSRAEERAMQVPVKITFPLVFCILPALFIVILGPAVIQITRGFGG